METFAQMNNVLKKYENNFIQNLLLTLPSNYIHLTNPTNKYQQVIAAFEEISHATKMDDELQQFFRELSINKQLWAKLQNPEQKYQYILKQLDKSIGDNKTKVSTQVNNYLSKGISQIQKQNKPTDPFEWLKLKNKYPMCQQKLKAKLVQAISDSKNQKMIRQRISNPNKPKVTLLDQSLVLDEYQNIKIDYKWTNEDEHVLINNINALKNKFNHTQFLKMCNRFRFISSHEFETLAAEEISRKLDQDNKVFLSRQFLLDKYYSTRQFLTEQEMRFILKTSPMLSKCVDKQFIRNAIKNIQYEDISKLELSIAENIIARFDQIRKAVRESRKNYKQNKNSHIKEQILQFQKRKELEIAREIAREELAKHKLTKVKSAKTLKYMAENGQSKKVFLPLNKYHPPSGLFVKDCNEQCNDDLFNSYELHYLQRDKMLKKLKTAPRNSISIAQFYTGGMDSNVPQISQDSILTICSIIKANYYQKSLKMTLDNYQINRCASQSVRSQLTAKMTIHSHKTNFDLDSKKKSTNLYTEESSELAIKKKILQSKEKAKGIVYVNKLLTLSAENNFVTFKALNAKFTPEQVNTKDYKGNTPLFYACKNQNYEFINFLLDAGADPSIACEKSFTPLHYIFRTNNLTLITRCLTAPKTPNLNSVNQQSKTPLAYCTFETLTSLNLQEGLAVVQNRMVEFDNNMLLIGMRVPKKKQLSRSSSRAGTNCWFPQ